MWFDWYYVRDVDAAARFAAEVEQVLGRVAASPQQFPIVHRDVRRALLQLFPYAVYFTKSATIDPDLLDELDDDERSELDDAISRAAASVQSGNGRSAEEVLASLRRR